MERALQDALSKAQGRGFSLELHLADTASSVTGSVEAAQGLIDSGVHALICCSDPAATHAVLPLVARAGVPLLALSHDDTGQSAPPAEEAYWAFSLLPGDAAVLEHLALEPDVHPLFLMAAQGTEGDAAARALASRRAGTVRYPAGRTPLTPEALWAITRTPRSILIWDDATGTLEAARALTKRGYSGARIVRNAVWSDLDALGRAGLTGAQSVLSPAALGYTLSDTHPSKAAVASLRRALIGLPGTWLNETTMTQAAALSDAVSLLAAAAEQVLGYSVGFAPQNPQALRQGLRDALIGLGPVVGAGGTYDFSEGDVNEGVQLGILPESLVLGTWRSGSFRPQ